MNTISKNKFKTHKTNARLDCRHSMHKESFKRGDVLRRKQTSCSGEPESQSVAAQLAQVSLKRGSVRSPYPTKPKDQVWTIVLAGGEGERLRPLMTRWLGHHRPKQYCTFVGNHSMLRHTLNRAEQLTDIERTRVVVARHHEPRLWDRLDDHHEAAIIAQPRNRDTAPGIFLPLTYIATRDAEATVVIFPSDHFVHPQEEFLVAIRRAVQVVDCHPEQLILLGVRPDTSETEYGWIQPGSPIGRIGGQMIRRVAGFREKPEAAEARQLLRSGGLWNTMVIAVRLQTLWRLGWRCFPEMMQHFEDFAATIDTDNEMRALDSLYETLAPANFSTGLLQQALDSLVVMELQDVLWSDWGCERRIVETLERIGKTPLFRTAAMNSPTRTVSTI